MKQGILRNGSNSSKLSTNSSEPSHIVSEPATPVTPPSRQASQSSYRSDFSDERLSPPGRSGVPRGTRNKPSVAWEKRPSLSSTTAALPLPPPLVDPAAAVAATQAPSALPPFVARQPQAPTQTILLPNKARFVGQTANTVATGHGVIYYENGDTYEGDVVDGLPQGYGVSRHAAGSTGFRGCFESGRQKQGVQTLRDGYVFDGCYRADAADGPGQLFDDRGFIMRALFVDGRAHGLAHVRFRSGDSYEGDFNYGRLACAPGVIRYPDGRVALRMIRHGAAFVEVVASRADGLFQKELLAQEQAIAREQWLELCEIRTRMRRMILLSDSQVHLVPQWSLAAWTPNDAQIKALSAILSGVGDNAGTTQKAMRHLVRSLLHLRGPARPYSTVGEMADTMQYTPARGYASMQEFVVDTVLPYCGTTKIILGSSATGDEPICFAYRMDGEPHFARRLAQAIDDVILALSAAYSKDVADLDGMLGRSHNVLCSVLDGTLTFDAKLDRLGPTLAMLHMDDVLPRAVARAVASASTGPRIGTAPLCNGETAAQRPPIVVAEVERGPSSQRRLAPQRTHSAPTHLRVLRSRSSSLPRRGVAELAGRLSPMIEVSDVPSSGSPTRHS